MKKINLLFILSLTAAFMLSCGKKRKEMGSTTISFKSLATTDLTQGGGQFILGMHQEADHNFVINTANQTDLVLPNGKWIFYSLGWDGTSPFTGTPKCGISNLVDLQGKEETISLVQSSDCSHPIFSGDNAFTGGTLNPITIVRCNDAGFSTVTGEASSCDSEIGGAQSFKVAFHPYRLSPSFDITAHLEPPLEYCINVSDPHTSSTVTTLSLPQGNGLGKWFMKFRAFDSANCSGGEGFYDLIGSLKQDDGIKKTYFTTGITKIFVKDHHSYTGPQPSGTPGSSSNPIAQEGLVLVSAGDTHSCALSTEGNVACWGDNANGQLGLGDTYTLGDMPWHMGYYLPTVNLDPVLKVKSLAIGSNPSCAILTNDQIKCWGSNIYGQLGLGHMDNIGDGSSEMGANLPIVDMGASQPVKKVYTSNYHTCAILNTDQIKCWGKNSDGQLGYDSMDFKGDDSSDVPSLLSTVNVGAGRTVLKMALGDNHSCVILDNGDVKCWGNGGYGQLGYENTQTKGDGSYLMSTLGTVGIPSLPAKDIVAGFQFNCIIDDSDDVVCWGNNNVGQLGIGSNYPMGDQPGEISSPTKAWIGAGRKAKQLAAGYNSVCAIRDTNDVVCWGNNNFGQLGIDSSVANVGTTGGAAGFTITPVNLGTGRTAKSISGGSYHYCAILDNDKMKCWGKNNNGSPGGQLGLGHTLDVGLGASTDLKLADSNYTSVFPTFPAADFDTWKTEPQVSHGVKWSSAASIHGNIYMFGGNDSGIKHNKIFQYNPTSGAWTIKPTVLGANYEGLSAVSSNNAVYLFGGYDTSYTATTYKYDFAADSLTAQSTLPGSVPRAYGCATTMFDAKIYYFGGKNASSTLSETLQFTPWNSVGTQFAVRANMPSPRAYHTCASDKDKIYVFGGMDGSGDVKNTVYEYSPQNNTWTAKAPMPTKVWGATAQGFNGKIFVMGGIDDQNNDRDIVQVYDVNSNTWSSGTGLPTTKAAVSSVYVNGVIYVLGGNSNTSDADVHSYIPLLPVGP